MTDEYSPDDAPALVCADCDEECSVYVQEPDGVVLTRLWFSRCCDASALDARQMLAQEGRPC